MNIICYWQHEDTGCIVKLKFWKNPGRRYYRIKLTKKLKFMYDRGLGFDDMNPDITYPRNN